MTACQKLCIRTSEYYNVNPEVLLVLTCGRKFGLQTQNWQSGRSSLLNPYLFSRQVHFRKYSITSIGKFAFTKKNEFYILSKTPQFNTSVPRKNHTFSAPKIPQFNTKNPSVPHQKSLSSTPKKALNKRALQ